MKIKKMKEMRIHRNLGHKKLQAAELPQHTQMIYNMSHNSNIAHSATWILDEPFLHIDEEGLVISQTVTNIHSGNVGRNKKRDL